MVRYFAFVFITNLAAAFFYQRIRQINLSKTIIIYTTGFSLLMSIIFPFILKWLNVFQLIFLYVFITSF